MSDVANDLIQRAAQIERERNNCALTAEEASTLKAVAFLRVIAPYLFNLASQTPPPEQP